ncbi:N,N'-diacetylchitobiose permease IIC [Shigella flexneri]|nr:N,N'-diacetylchitobiose permease IIC [Shigella flexneri]
MPQVFNAQAIIPITERIIKPGINAEKERDTEAGTLSGSLMTQLLVMLPTY